VLSRRQDDIGHFVTSKIKAIAGIKDTYHPHPFKAFS